MSRLPGLGPAIPGDRDDMGRESKDGLRYLAMRLPSSEDVLRNPPPDASVSMNSRSLLSLASRNEPDVGGRITRTY